MIRLAGILSLTTVAALAQPEQTLSATDAGGGRSAGAGEGFTVTNDATIGGPAGSFTGAALRHHTGYAGQLYDPVNISVEPDPAEVMEESGLQLSAHFVCDDDTTLPASSVLWDNAGSTFFTVSGEGRIIAEIVPGSIIQMLRVSAGELSADVPLFIRDSTPDNYPPFAGDELDDAWQWRWFHDSPPDAPPREDPDGDGQNNRLEFLAGTSPLDGASFLQARIEPDISDPTARRLLFTPWLPMRQYTWEWSNDLELNWRPVPGAAVTPGDTGDGQARDPAAIEPRKLYRLRIE